MSGSGTAGRGARSGRLAVALLALGAMSALAAGPEPVRFMSRDGATEIAGQLYPADVNFLTSFLSDSELRSGMQGRRAAMVLIEDTAGPEAAARSRAWAKYWSEAGLTVLVMTQGATPVPRTGPRTSLWETDEGVRPLDAYGALDFLRARPDILPARIGLQSWGATAATVFAALDLERNADVATGRGGGFRAAVVLYPTCRTLDPARFRSYAPLVMLIAGADASGNAAACLRFAVDARDRSLDFLTMVLDGAPEGFDAPTRQAAHAAALERAQTVAQKFAGTYLRP